MRKSMTIVALSLALAVTLLLPVSRVTGQVGQEALKNCAEFAFSTEEDFVTGGPEPPDGNPIISDGDLLGVVYSAAAAPQCAVCARNQDLLAQGFDVTDDLGLDAADVIDAETYVVAFSTELDSPHGDQFTAGDLLVISGTLGIIIPNIALTDPYTVGYDIGLDAVHFVGDAQNIIAFLDEASQKSRDDWLMSPSTLSQTLARREIDIWFSTEGTMGPVMAPAFLDGDLLSARDGVIIASNGDLLPSSVPAGIPDRGVDFGLDAVTADRTAGKELTFFSTEILYEERPSFTDGDVLQLGSPIVVRTNKDLVGCFEPKASFLGLDALSVAIGEPLPECAAKIIQVGGMSTGSINPDGYANGTSISTVFEAHDSPFGKWVQILGLLPDCRQCRQFKVEYGQWAGPTTPPTTFYALMPEFDEWVVASLGLEALVHRKADAQGWYDILCNPKAGGLLLPWYTGGKNGKYSLRLTIKDAGGVEHVSAPVVVMLDNKYPTASLSVDTVPVCGDITEGITVTGTFTGTDEHFYGYRLRYESSIHSGTLITRTYTSLADTGGIAQPFSWPTAGLSKCGYRLVLEVWDRTIVNNTRSYGDPGFGWRKIDQAYFCLRAQ